MTQVPISLKRDPIAECTFELRFGSNVPSVGDLLPGMLFSYFKDDFPSLAPLPASQIPKILRNSDANLAYQALHVLDGAGKRILLGERVAALSILRPYGGWTKTEPLILALIDQLRRTGVISNVERFSLRYTNVIQPAGQSDLQPFEVDLRLAKFPPRSNGLQIQAEIELNGCITIVQLVPGASIGIQRGDTRETLQGVMFVVDTVRSAGLTDFLTNPSQLLKIVHDTEKMIFFSLLKKATIDSLEPVWGEE